MDRVRNGSTPVVSQFVLVPFKEELRGDYVEVRKKAESIRELGVFGFGRIRRRTLLEGVSGLD